MSALIAWFRSGCPDCDADIEPGDPVVPVTGGTPDERLGYAHAHCPITDPWSLAVPLEVAS